MIIEIREHDCYPCQNPIIKITNDKPYPTYNKQYNLNSSIEDIDRAIELCEDCLSELANIRSKLNA